MSTQIPTANTTNGPWTGQNIRKRQGPLYDSIKVAAAGTIAAGTSNLFNGNIMDAGGLGPDFTNMGDVGKLSNMLAFRVMSLRLMFVGCATADVTTFCQINCVRLNVGGIKMLEAPPDYWPGGGGSSTGANNGIADPRAVVGLDLDPIDISLGMQFRLTFISSALFTASAAFFMRAYLDGEITEAV